ncbi:organic cation transporter protein-like [Frankliniella occidentalis]|uniref:Organic cation transporter protein-like n=1 Tax=Frankliniella occidentalis TaxID=133901 RepID=A0A6J1RRA3_FRAOC|nr:organic cation transporter protein-like [Frankliniella occidentalis]
MEFEPALEALSKRFGRFHLVTLSLICMTYVFQALFYLSYVFTTLRSDHRCHIPECDQELSEMAPSWLPMAVPLADGLPDPCRRFVALPGIDGDSCTAEAFSNLTQECTQWVYPNKELSIMTEWDLTPCASGGDWQVTLVGTMNNIGRVLGLPLSGYLSDRYGRKTILLASLAVSGVIGIARSVSPSYMFFIVLEFIDPMFYDGMGSSALVMGMEVLPSSARGAWSVASHVVFALGQALLGAVAWALPYWRWLLRALYSSALLTLPLLWLFLPESMRWLVSKGRVRDAQNILRKAAKMNRSESTCQINFDKVELSGVTKESDGSADEKPDISTELMALLRSRILAFRLFNCCFAWVAIMFVYDGLSINSVTMAGNRYLNFILVVLIEIPGALVTAKMMTLFGRRLSLSGSFILAAFCCFAFHFLPADVPWPRTAAVLLAKLCVTISFTVIYVLSTELFPTSVRATLFATCATMGRMGSVLAPQTPQLGRLLDALPMLVFGGAAMVSGLLALTFPDMGDEALPDTIAEAEALGRKSMRRRKTSSVAPAPAPAPALTQTQTPVEVALTIPEAFVTHL